MARSDNDVLEFQVEALARSTEASMQVRGDARHKWAGPPRAVRCARARCAGGAWSA